jgi:hypothetical protein
MFSNSVIASNGGFASIGDVKALLAPLAEKTGRLPAIAGRAFMTADARSHTPRWRI